MSAMGLRSWFTRLRRRWKGPSFEELRETHIARARRLSRAEAIDMLEKNVVLGHPACADQRREILALVAAGPLGPAERARCEELLDAALRAQSYLLRPGTVEEVWWIAGLLDRLSEGDRDGK